MLFDLKEAVAGDIVQENVVGPNSVVICSKGTRLTERLIEGLENRGIKSIELARERSEASPTSEAQNDAIAESLNSRFEWVTDDPFMMSLKEAAGRVLSKHAQEMLGDES